MFLSLIAFIRLLLNIIMCNKAKEPFVRHFVRHGGDSSFRRSWLPESPVSYQWPSVLSFHDGKDLGRNSSQVHDYASANVAVVAIEHHPPVRSGHPLKVSTTSVNLTCPTWTSAASGSLLRYAGALCPTRSWVGLRCTISQGACHRSRRASPRRRRRRIPVVFRVPSDLGVQEQGQVRACFQVIP